MQNKKASKMKNISFGRLEIGSQISKKNSKEAILEFIEGNDSLATGFSDLCDTINGNSGEDLFILEVANNKKIGRSSFELNAQATDFEKKGTIKPKKLNIFKETIGTDAPVIQKQSFFDKLYTSFINDKETGQYLIYNISKQCLPANPNSCLTFIPTKTKIENLLCLTKGDKNFSDELAMAFTKIANALNRNKKSAELTVKYIYFRGTTRQIMLTLKCTNGEIITTGIDIDAQSEAKCAILKNYVQEIEKTLARNSSGTNEKLNSVFDKYC